VKVRITSRQLRSYWELIHHLIVFGLRIAQCRP
jgi:hypothetical protein